MQLQGAVPARTSSALQVDLDMTLDDHENNIKNNGNGDNKSSGSPNSNDDSRGSDDANSAGNGNSAGRFSNREKDQFKFRTYGIDFNQVGYT